jgi:hypothetical protein
LRTLISINSLNPLLNIPLLLISFSYSKLSVHELILYAEPTQPKTPLSNPFNHPSYYFNFNFNFEFDLDFDFAILSTVSNFIIILHLFKIIYFDLIHCYLLIFHRFIFWVFLSPFFYFFFFPKNFLKFKKKIFFSCDFFGSNFFFFFVKLF